MPQYLDAELRVFKTSWCAEPYLEGKSSTANTQRLLAPNGLYVH